MNQGFQRKLALYTFASWLGFLSALPMALAAPSDEAIETMLGDYMRNPYHNVLRSGHFYQNRGQYMGNVDLLIPFAEKPRALWFVDLRGADDRNSAFALNVGIGYRRVDPLNRWMSGYYLFYDWYRSQYDKYFSQLSTGFERKSRNWSFIGNAYVPIGKIDRRETQFDQPFLVDAGLNNDLMHILLAPGFEKALYGTDFEIGRAVPHIEGLSAFLAGYLFAGTHLKPLLGSRFRVAYDIHGFTGSLSRLLNHFSIEAAVQNDKPRGTHWYAGLRMRVDAANPMPLMGARKHMLDYIRKETNIITKDNHRLQLQYFVSNADNSLTTVGVGTDASSLKNAFDESADVVVVRGDIVVPKASLPCQMSDGQTLTGDLFVAADGTRIHLSTGGSITAIPSSQSLGMFKLAKDNSIRDITLNNGSVIVLNNNSEAGVGNLVIDHLTSGGGVSVSISDASTDSTLTFTNNHISLINPITNKNALLLSLSNSSSVLVKKLSNNTFDINSTQASAIKMSTSSSANITFDDDIKNNTINFSGVGSSSKGIWLQALGAGTIDLNHHSIINNTLTMLGSNSIGIYLAADGGQLNNVGKIGYNTILFTNSSSSNTGIWLSSIGPTSQLDTDDITSNQISFANALGATGINLSSTSGHITAGSLYNNQITLGSGSGARGISLFSSSPGTTIMVEDLSDNTVTFGNNAPNSVGIDIRNLDNLTDINDIKDNHFTFGDADNQLGIKIRTSFQGLTEINSIHNNIFTFASGNHNKGLDVEMGFGGSLMIFSPIEYNTFTFGTGDNNAGIFLTSTSINHVVSVNDITHNTFTFNGNMNTGIKSIALGDPTAPLTIGTIEYNSITGTGNENRGISNLTASNGELDTGSISHNTIQLTGNDNIGIDNDTVSATVSTSMILGGITYNHITITGDDGIGINNKADDTVLSLTDHILGNHISMIGNNNIGLHFLTLSQAQILFSTGKGIDSNLFSFDGGTTNTGILIDTVAHPSNVITIERFRGNSFEHKADTTPPSEDIALVTTGTAIAPFEVNVTVDDGANGLSDANNSASIATTGSAFDIDTGL